MFNRQTSGSVVCPSCGKLVGVNQEACVNCGRRNPGMWGYGKVLQRLGKDFGATKIILAGCIGLYVLSLFLDFGARGDGGGFALSPSGESLRALGASGPRPVIFEGRWWTVLSAGWLHGGLIHIFFNMMWVRQLAPAAAHVYGPGRMFLVYLLSSAAGFALSALGGTYLRFLGIIMGGSPYSISVGASAAIFGLLGALVYAGRRGVASHLGRTAWGYAVILFLFGLVFPGVDNWAHLGGFLGGYAVARWLNPHEQERPDHVLASLVLLVATAVAIGLSFVRALRLGP
ncbi:MAG: rhomboid family intramembrane serine protease [Acidobacteriota bacterium]|nr:rhomboid family intramembrane serine protease [Acidobacteriota bacterium]